MGEGDGDEGRVGERDEEGEWEGFGDVEENGEGDSCGEIKVEAEEEGEWEGFED